MEMDEHQVGHFSLCILVQRDHFVNINKMINTSAPRAVCLTEPDEILYSR